jgi:hypothetical protein
MVPVTGHEQGLVRRRQEEDLLSKVAVDKGTDPFDDLGLLALEEDKDSSDQSWKDSGT